MFSSHCDACKEINGGEFTLNQVVPEENFKLEKGNLTKYTYKGDSGMFSVENTYLVIAQWLKTKLGKPVHCFFCPTCSTHVYHHQTLLGPKYIVRTAALEGAKEWPVHAEIYCKDTAKWLPKLSEHNFPAAPPS